MVVVLRRVYIVILSNIFTFLEFLYLSRSLAQIFRFVLNHSMPLTSLRFTLLSARVEVGHLLAQGNGLSLLWRWTDLSAVLEGPHGCDDRTGVAYRTELVFPLCLWSNNYETFRGIHML